MRKLISFCAAAAVVTTAASAGYRDSVDADGCWDARDQYGGKCLIGDTEWNGERFTLILQNKCAQRVYARFCNQKARSSYHDCGSSGVQGYGTKRWTTSSNATGRSQWRSVGATNPNKDYVCGGKIRGWTDKMFY
jgi:hypothetical protein